MFDRHTNQWPTISFCVTVLLHVGIEYMVFAALIFLGVPYWIAQPISYLCAIMNGYQMNRTFSFKRSRWSTRFGFWKFVGITFLSLLLTSALLFVCYVHYGLSIWIGKCIVTVLGLFVQTIGSIFSDIPQTSTIRQRNDRSAQ